MILHRSLFVLAAFAVLVAAASIYNGDALDGLAAGVISLSIAQLAEVTQ